MQRVRVKICGITNLADAHAAVEAGADALGFNFFKGSPRYLTPADAGRIICEMPPDVLCVGVVVNESREAVEAAVSESSVAAVQLHGDETPEFCESLDAKRVIKAFRGQSGFDPDSVKHYSTEAILFDAYEQGAWGGTGRAGDWELARRVREAAPQMYLAGGLSPDNVAEAIATVAPFGVDLCSGVECAPGRKDHALVRRFVAAARAAGEKLDAGRAVSVILAPCERR